MINVEAAMTDSVLHTEGGGGVRPEQLDGIGGMIERGGYAS